MAAMADGVVARGSGAQASARGPARAGLAEPRWKTAKPRPPPKS